MCVRCSATVAQEATAATFALLGWVFETLSSGWLTQGLAAPVKGTQQRGCEPVLCAPLRADSGPVAGTEMGLGDEPCTAQTVGAT